MSLMPKAFPLAAFGLLLLGGCTVGPDYEAPPLPAGIADRAPQFAETGTAASNAPLPAHWWRLYNDPALDALVEEALAANTDLRAAAANLDRARAVLEEAHAAAGIQTSVGAGLSRAETSSLGVASPTSPYTTADAGISLSYEIDVVGRIRRTLEASEADADAQAAAYDLARTTVAAGVVSAYSGACAAGARIAVAQRSIGLQRQSLGLTERGQKAGVYTTLDATRSQVLLTQLEAMVPPLESSRKAALYSLAALLGRAPEAYPAALANCAMIPAVNSAIPAGDGTALIRRRPDIRQAERQLAAATARIGVATADLYPKVTLGASIGSTSRETSQMFDDSAFRFSFGPLISWSFPNTQVARARIAEADATTQAALATFDGKVLAALRDTETALSTYARDLEQNAKLEIARDESRKAMDLQTRMTRGGLASGLDLLDAERTLATAEAALAQSNATVADDRVRLFLALGGGWETE